MKNSRHKLNLHYISIVENTSGAPPVIQGNTNNPNENNTTVKNIIKQYENDSSIIRPLVVDLLFIVTHGHQKLIIFTIIFLFSI